MCLQHPEPEGVGSLSTEDGVTRQQVCVADLLTAGWSVPLHLH